MALPKTMIVERRYRMYPTTQKFKDYVYSIDDARQFTPEVTICVIDIFARQICSYTTNSLATFSNRAEVYDGTLDNDHSIGTLEDMQFMLDGKHEFLASAQNVEGGAGVQVGIMSGMVSNSVGVFDTPFVVTCQYAYPISSFRRVLYFNNKELSIPKRFKVDFYNGATLLYTTTVTNNNSYIYKVDKAVDLYDKVVLTFYETTHKLSRVKIIEDVPGDYITYESNEVISVVSNCVLDMLLENVTNDEIDISLLNLNKNLNVLSNTGLEKYLQMLQELDVFIIANFPDGTKERIPLGKHFLYSWQAISGTLRADFTIRDAEEKLSLGTYPGLWKSTPITFHALAVEVLQTAGITKYSLPERLKNYTTNGLTSSYTCKEALRLIAQAMQCIILSNLNGGVDLVYVGTPTSWYTQVDSLDYSVLYEKPTIKESKKLTSSVIVSISTNTIAASATSLFSGSYSILGSQTIEVSYSASTEISAAVTNGTLVSATYYATKAKLVIAASGSVTVSITGKLISTTKTSYTALNPDVNASQSVYAEAYVVNNSLITSSTLAQACANYYIFWKNRKYEYSFNWRQNPAIKLFDPVKVHDDFSNDNVTLITEQNIDYSGCVLSGSSKSIY